MCVDEKDLGVFWRAGRHDQTEPGSHSLYLG